MTIKVQGWVEQDKGACSFYRMEQPFHALFAGGVNASASRYVRGDDLLDAGVTLVVAQRVVDPNAIIILDALKQRGVPYLYETDDLLTAVDPENPVSHFYAKKAVKVLIDTAIRNSAGITVSTPELAAEMGGYGLPVWELPNSLPDYFGGPLFRSGQGHEGEVRVVWAGSLTHHGDFHEKVRYGLRKAVRNGAAFYCVGADYRSKLGGLGKHVPWSRNIPAFHRTLPRYDIGLAPLKRSRFNECKSELKVIEYQAAGVVPVAEDIAPYRRAIRHGVDGFLCRTEHEWKEAIETLVSDSDLRHRMRLECLSLTSDRLIGARVGMWESAYTEASPLPV